MPRGRPRRVLSPQSLLPKRSYPLLPVEFAPQLDGRACWSWRPSRVLAIACQHVEQPPSVLAARSRLADFDAHFADAPRAANLRGSIEEKTGGRKEPPNDAQHGLHRD